jgi:hypothetical protein
VFDNCRRLISAAEERANNALNAEKVLPEIIVANETANGVIPAAPPPVAVVSKGYTKDLFSEVARFAI